MLQLNFWISELAQRTGVSTRTIRYYIEEGLLPQPQIEGKYAVFNEDYLIRLQLIKALKDAYLPLREIKAKLDSMMVTEMRDVLHRFEQDPLHALAELDIYPTESSKSAPIAAAKLAEPDNAADYIQRALNRKTALAREPGPRFNASMPAPRPNSAPVAESWQRVELAPGVELNYRLPQTAMAHRQMQELIEFARKIFTK